MVNRKKNVKLGKRRLKKNCLDYLLNIKFYLYIELLTMKDTLCKKEARRTQEVILLNILNNLSNV